MNGEPIGDHAIIGDCRSAALVSRGGSIDWLCWPRFDSPSIFGELLGDGAGHWRIAPDGAARIERRYVPRTNVLRTVFHAAGGRLALTDLMPVASEDEKRAALVPDQEILRTARCEEGTVAVTMTFEPRPGYGARRPRLRDRGPLGLCFDCDGGIATLRSSRPWSVQGETVVSRCRLQAGQTLRASLTFASELPAVLRPLDDQAEGAVERSVRWWSRWIERCGYAGPEREAVLRSALLLRLMVYAPSGAVVAAPTTSLPERPGGALNWDYRYCWLRDASLTARALLGLGFVDEARAFVSWLLYSTRLTRPRLRTLYDVHGNAPIPERELENLAGYEGSRPVRVGNAARDQLQLDVYGEVIDAAARFARAGGTFDRETQRMLRGLGSYVRRNWARPDEGMWEPRSGRSRHTHSLVLCWAALDRLLELASGGRIRRLPTDGIRRTRDRIRHEVQTRCWNARLNSYVSAVDGSEPDASLLLLPWYGFEPAGSPRMRGTEALIRKRLGAGRGLLYRRPSEGPAEGAFGPCAFWRVECLALREGSAGEAAETFSQLCGLANDVGLFAEELDPASGRALGNFPQAFTHVALINAALTLERRAGGGPPGEESAS